MDRDAVITTYIFNFWLIRVSRISAKIAFLIYIEGFLKIILLRVLDFVDLDLQYFNHDFKKDYIRL